MQSTTATTQRPDPPGIINGRPIRTRSDAKEAGLTVFSWGITCKACGTRDKFVKSSRCATCADKPTPAQKAAEAKKARARRARAKLVEAERAQRQALKDKAKAERLEVKRRAQMAATRAANKAKRLEEAAKAAALGDSCEVPTSDPTVPRWLDVDEVRTMAGPADDLEVSLEGFGFDDGDGCPWDD